MKLILGDSKYVLKDIPDSSVELILTDPLYDLDTETKDMYHTEFERISKNGIIVFCPPENLWKQPASQYGFWIKPISTKNTSKRYSRFVEQILFYDTKVWNTQYNWSQYTNVFTDLVNGSSKHPYEKPISLLIRLIRIHSNKGDTILDPFMGSGSTGVAAALLGRGFIGIEKNAAFFETAKHILAAY